MRKAFALVLVAALLLMLVGVVVFRLALDLSWLDSAYFVVTLMTTVGFGDINLRTAPPAVKVFGCFLMLAGAASMAATFGVITDFLLKARLQRLFAPRGHKMKDHVVVCGLGNVGYRVLERLLELGETVVVVEKNDGSRFIENVRARNIPVVLGDVRLPDTLDRANIAAARSIVAVSDDDLANVEAALNAKNAQPEIRVVLRVFDQNLAKKLEDGLGVQTAFSTSALAAPAFATAAVDPSVVGSFYVGDELVLNVEMEVRPGSELVGMDTERLREVGDLSVLSLEKAGTAQRLMHPSVPIELEAGDRLVIAACPDLCAKLRTLNGDHG